MSQTNIKVDPDDAHKRAIEDYSQFAQYTRSSAQFAFAANGGAAVAILSYLTAIINSSNKNPTLDISAITRGFTISCSIYLTGLFFSIISMYLFSISKLYWGNYWEGVAKTGELNFEGRRSTIRRASHVVGWVFLILSALLFVPGSVFAVLGFFKQ
jgi:hypothetical protein